MTREIWRPILESDYHEVSNMGRVRKYWIIEDRIHYSILNPYLNAKGYYQFAIYIEGGGGRRIQPYVARMVAKAFIPNPNNKPQVNHKDGNPRNNRVDNLEWCTPKENTRHGWKTGLCHQSKQRYIKGEEVPQHKLTERKVRIIKHALSLDKGNRSGIVKCLSKLFNVNHASICDIRSGRAWKHIAI